ncbi:DUF6473 family protein [uncultured Litoreibacter sp.]|uniref:DUF6473 family protein n=1 Tax=uncultured Litoreibacter sp. TaxID=1392394 RepID=UPI002602FDAE|nr:DUF6473 family protein [uncultured Litoreibacter sp.]
MAYERPGESPINYQQCRYGNSKLLFRGPKGNTKQKFMAFIGGTETYGKYILQPFPNLIQNQLGMPCLNFGAVNGGVDAFANDDSILSICSRARVTVVQVMGAHNMSNRFYSVHPRRNDRFLKASTLMRTIFREVDFTEFAFTRHLLTTLKTLSPDKFEVLEQELKAAWLARMELLLSKISGKVVLLWVSEEPPSDPKRERDLGKDPLFVDRTMIAGLRELVSDYVEIVVPRDIIDQGTEGMLYPELEAAAAREMYGPGLHRMISDRLVSVLS